MFEIVGSAYFLAFPTIFVLVQATQFGSCDAVFVTGPVSTSLPECAVTPAE